MNSSFHGQGENLVKKYLLLVILYTSMTIGIAGLAACAGPDQDDASAQGQISSAAIARVTAPEKLKPNTDALQWRFIGPITGNRGSAVAGHPTNKTCSILVLHQAFGKHLMPDSLGSHWETGNSRQVTWAQ
jgi:hypothetical protein